MSFEFAIILVIIMNSVAVLPLRNKIKIRNVLLLVLMCLFLSTIREGPDINNYINLFQSDYIAKDQGFAAFSRWFYKNGWNYYQFQTLVYTISISLIAQGVLRRFDRRTLVYILFFFYPFLLNAVQIRSMLSGAILVCAFCICYDYRGSLLGKVIWCLSLIIATAFHVAMIIFIPFIFIWDKPRLLNNGLKIVIGVIIALYIAPSNIISFMVRIASYFADATRVSSYMTRSTRLGGLIMIALAIFVYLICRFSKESQNRLLINQNGYEYQINTDSFLLFVERLTKYSLFFTPLYVLNANFTRLMQCESVIFYGVFVTALQVFRLSRKQGLMDIFMKNREIDINILFGYVFLYNSISLWWNQWDTIIVPFFSNLL